MNGTRVVVQLKPKNNWIPGTVIRKIRDRTYLIKIDNGSEYVRNRIFLKVFKEKVNSEKQRNHHLFKSEGKEETRDEKKYYIELEREEEERRAECGVEHESKGGSEEKYVTVSEKEPGTSEVEEDREQASVNLQKQIMTKSDKVVRKPDRLNL